MIRELLDKLERDKNNYIELLNSRNDFDPKLSVLYPTSEISDELEAYILQAIELINSIQVRIYTKSEGWLSELLDYDRLTQKIANCANKFLEPAA